jgi:hypothetical protein
MFSVAIGWFYALDSNSKENLIIPFVLGNGMGLILILGAILVELDKRRK